MRDFLKIIGLVFAGLAAALVIYPALHEGGHAVTALIIGAGIKGISLFPRPFVACEVADVSQVGQMFIGLGGIISPFVISMLLKPKNFWLWYTNLLVKSISVYATLLSIVALICHINGNSWENEDIVKAVQALPRCAWLLLGLLVIMSIYGAVRIIKEKLFSRCVDYFVAPQKSPMQMKKQDSS